jgi:hypothetical protein
MPIPERHTMNNTAYTVPCECDDPDCGGCGHRNKNCGSPSTNWVSLNTVNYRGVKKTSRYRFCDYCTTDALDSGVFTSE